MNMVVDGKARASRKAVPTGQNSEKSRNIQKQPSAAMTAHASEAPARLIQDVVSVGRCREPGADPCGGQHEDDVADVVRLIEPSVRGAHPARVGGAGIDPVLAEPAGGGEQHRHLQLLAGILARDAATREEEEEAQEEGEPQLARSISVLHFARYSSRADR